MFIRKQRINGHVYYSVVENFKPEGRQKTTRPVVPLGRERSLDKAYERALKAYEQAADRLGRLESALIAMGPGCEYRGGR